MGDRANVYITETNTGGDKGIYLYTHWSGERWPEMLGEALTFGSGRWGDNSYLTRIIISRMFSNLVDSETGGGVSLYLTDNEYDITCVDLDAQEVGWAARGSEASRPEWYGVISFEDFIKDPKYGNAVDDDE